MYQLSNFISRPLKSQELFILIIPFKCRNMLLKYFLYHTRTQAETCKLLTKNANFFGKSHPGKSYLRIVPNPLPFSPKPSSLVSHSFLFTPHPSPFIPHHSSLTIHPSPYIPHASKYLCFSQLYDCYGKNYTIYACRSLYSKANDVSKGSAGA